MRGSATWTAGATWSCAAVCFLGCTPTHPEDPFSTRWSAGDAMVNESFTVGWQPAAAQMFPKTAAAYVRTRDVADTWLASFDRATKLDEKCWDPDRLP